MAMEELKTQLLQGDLYRIIRGEVSALGVIGFMETYDFLSLYTFLEKNRPREEYKLFVCLCENSFNEFVKCIENKKEVLIPFLEENDLYYSLKFL